MYFDKCGREIRCTVDLADSQEICRLYYIFINKNLSRESSAKARRDRTARVAWWKPWSSSRRRTSSSSFHSRDIEWSHVKTTKSHKSKPWISTSEPWRTDAWLLYLLSGIFARNVSIWITGNSSQGHLKFFVGHLFPIYLVSFIRKRVKRLKRWGGLRIYMYIIGTFISEC